MYDDKNYLSDEMRGNEMVVEKGIQVIDDGVEVENRDHGTGNIRSK